MSYKDIAANFFGAEMESHQFTAGKSFRRETPMYRAFAASRPSTPNQLPINSQPRTLARLADFEYLCPRKAVSDSSVNKHRGMEQ